MTLHVAGGRGITVLKRLHADGAVKDAEAAAFRQLAEQGFPPARGAGRGG